MLDREEERSAAKTGDGASEQAPSQTMRAQLSLRAAPAQRRVPAGNEDVGAAVGRAPWRLEDATATGARDARARGPAREPPRGGGYAVRGFTQADVEDAIELRGVLEGTAVRFAAERGASKRQLAEMRELGRGVDEAVHRADVGLVPGATSTSTSRFHALFLRGRLQSGSRADAGANRCRCPSPRRPPSCWRQAELPESREILVDCQRTPGSDRGDRAPRGCAGRGPGPRARSRRPAQSGNRGWRRHQGPVLAERLPGGRRWLGQSWTDN